MTDAKEELTITMPLYKWLMLIGATSALADGTWYDTLVDQVFAAVGP